MMRSPCCEKMGVKKGAWTPEEDQILISYIQRHGHGNWRALPRQAGLLRCGKSCRLRWTNYLRPDVKRGNFSVEEEETITQLHKILGNRWSAIAMRLPGLTDNEIKNFWHTRLKKRYKQNMSAATDTIIRQSIGTTNCNWETRKSEPTSFSNDFGFEGSRHAMISTQQFYDSFSSSHSSPITTIMKPIKEACMNTSGNITKISELSTSSTTSESPGIVDPRHQLLYSQDCRTEPVDGSHVDVNRDMVFWYNLFIKAGESHNG